MWWRCRQAGKAGQGWRVEGGGGGGGGEGETDAGGEGRMKVGKGGNGLRNEVQGVEQ